MNFGRKPVSIGPYSGLTYPVSEGRFEALIAALEQNASELNGYKSTTEIPRQSVGAMRKRVAELLIEFDQHVPDSFYESKDYPISVVADALAFFTSYGTLT